MSEASDAEARAETARADLVHTLDQLRDNLKPANLVDEAMASAKINATAVTDQVMAVAKQHPLPALMIGAGVAMILGFGARGRSGPTSPTIEKSPAAPAPAWRAPDDPGVVPPDTQADDVLGRANHRLKAAATRARGAARPLFSSSKRSDRMAWSRNSVGASLARLVDEQPLILGAVGVALGAALGAALPHTDTEDGLLGEHSHSLKAAARSMAEDQVAQVKTAAEHAVADLKQTAADHGLNTENLSGLAQDVGEKAKSAVYEAGQTRSS